MDQILKDIVAIIEALGTSGLAAAIVAVITSRWGGLKQTPQTVPPVPTHPVPPGPTDAPRGPIDKYAEKIVTRQKPPGKKPLPPHGG